MIAVLRRVHREQRGFTLIELLVATAIGVTVLLVAGTIATAFMHAQLRVSDRGEEIARGRTAMEQIVQQLRSQVCLGPGYPAITYGSDNEVTFYGDLAQTTFTPDERDLTFSNGQIVERDYAGTATGGQPPFTFASTPYKTRVILDHVQLQTASGSPVPFFQYFMFDANSPIRPDRLLATPLSASDAARVVQMTISFQALASRGGDSTSAEPFTANVYVRTADPTDPDHSPLCI